MNMYQVDAFAERLFEGNPAAVVVTEEELPAALMQSIANENNLAETAVVSGYPSGELNIRWFTPTLEVDLCGHATMAAAHVLFTEYGVDKDIRFGSKSGPLEVYRKDGKLWLNFPADTMMPSDAATQALVESALQRKVVSVHRGRFDLMAVLSSQQELETLEPLMDAIAKLDCRGLIVTAAGRETDFVSRFFAPQCGVPEDPVTGSAHTSLTPYWAGVLNKTRLSARQLSPRGGSLTCVLEGDRVHMGGYAVTYLRGEMAL